jgi:hypothetical protein
VIWRVVGYGIGILVLVAGVYSQVEPLLHRRYSRKDRENG